MKTLISLLMVMMFSQGQAAEHSHMSSGDAPAVHGMLMFGQTEVFLSHLPMFHSPHDYQVLLKIKIDADSLAKYKNSLKKFPQEKVYTLVPQVFVLPDMINHPVAFKAQIFRGHFERGGSVIADSVSVEIAKVLHFRKYDPAAQKPAQAKFLLFGNSSEQYLAHYIEAKPDYDLIAQIQPLDSLNESSQEVAQEFFSQSPNSEMPAANSQISGSFTQDAKPKNDIQLLQQIYLETGDLSF